MSLWPRFRHRLAIKKLPGSFELISRISSHPTVFFSHNKPAANSTFSTINQRNEATNQTVCPVAIFWIQKCQRRKKYLSPSRSAIRAPYRTHHLTPIVPSNPRKPKKVFGRNSSGGHKNTPHFLVPPLRRIDQPSAQAPLLQIKHRHMLANPTH